MTHDGTYPRRRGASFFLLVAGALAGACRGNAKARADAGAAPSVLLVEQLEAEAGAHAREPPPIHPMGAPVASDLYDFTLESVKPCSNPAPAKDAEARHGAVWLGAKVRIKAKMNAFSVSPRHVSLRDRGVIFEAKMGEPLEGCTPALKPVSLRNGEDALGFVVFELPGPRENLVVEYQPARWGGAPMVRVATSEPPDAH